jgi:hypothetical protein
MGSPLAFEYRREELRMIGGNHDDANIADSYLGERGRGRRGRILISFFIKYIVTYKSCSIESYIVLQHNILSYYNLI